MPFGASVPQVRSGFSKRTLPAQVSMPNAGAQQRVKAVSGLSSQVVICQMILTG
jgi:hypothetical protein